MDATIVNVNLAYAAEDGSISQRDIPVTLANIGLLPTHWTFIIELPAHYRNANLGGERVPDSVEGAQMATVIEQFERYTDRYCRWAITRKARPVVLVQTYNSHPNEWPVLSLNVRDAWEVVDADGVISHHDAQDDNYGHRITLGEQDFVLDPALPENAIPLRKLAAMRDSLRTAATLISQLGESEDKTAFLNALDVPMASDEPVQAELPLDTPTIDDEEL